MRVTKIEKIWLAIIILLYIAYNFPGVPAYGESVPTLVHAAVTVIPLWLCTYLGLGKVYKIYKIKDQ